MLIAAAKSETPMHNNDTLKLMIASQREATVHCMNFANRSLRAAAIQVHRIWHRPRPPCSTDFLASEIFYQDMLTDIHFYFISLRNTYRYLSKVVEDPAFEPHRIELEKLNTAWFSHYAKGREAFEHIDQRLPGEKHQSRIISSDDGMSKLHYGINPSDRLFLHSDQEWDISEITFKKIYHDVTELISSIINSCDQLNSD